MYFEQEKKKKSSKEKKPKPHTTAKIIYVSYYWTFQTSKFQIGFKIVAHIAYAIGSIL